MGFTQLLPESLQGHFITSFHYPKVHTCSTPARMHTADLRNVYETGIHYVQA
jgi:hypothetical protein